MKRVQGWNSGFGIPVRTQMELSEMQAVGYLNLELKKDKGFVIHKYIYDGRC